MKFPNLAGRTSRSARQALWTLFRRSAEVQDDIPDREALGVLLFDLLCRMGFEESHSSFVVTSALDWCMKEIEAGRPGVVQLVDQRMMYCCGEYEDGFQAWDIVEMRKATYRDMPRQPLISLAISTSELFNTQVKRGPDG